MPGKGLGLARQGRRWLLVGLAYLAGLNVPHCQAAQAGPAAAAIKVTVVRGEGAVRQPGIETPAVVLEVRDERGQALAGAVAVFQLPEAGPGGVFSDGSRFATVATDEKGQATSPNLRANSLGGAYEIRVTVSYRGRAASLGIAQKNAAPTPMARKRGGSGKWIALVAIAGGAVAGAAIAAGGGKGPPQQPRASTTVTVGSGWTVGPPPNP